MRSVTFTLVAFVALSTSAVGEWDQWLGPKRDAVWEEKGLTTKFPKDGPPVVWRQPIGPGYAGPAVVGKHLYIMDRVPAKIDPDKPAPKGTQPGSERVQCLNVADGKTVWEHKYDCTYANVSYPTGPRTTPVVEGNRVFTLGTMGDLRCLNAADGTVIWSKNFVKDFKAPVPAWGWSAHLLLDGDTLIALVGGEGQAVMAFDKKTGKDQWKAVGGG